MDLTSANLPDVGQPIHGYSRADVDDFLAAVAQERARLEAEIADANRRTSQARNAIGMHRVMTAMVLEAHRELSELRRAATLEAEQIVAQADIDAQRLLQEARVAAIGADAPPSTPLDVFAAPSNVEMIDLTANVGPGEPSQMKPPTFRMGAFDDAETAQSDDYFDFLRGALADDEPLGPLPG